VSTQGPEKKGPDFLSRLGQTLRSSAETLVQETKELTKVGKLKVEILSLENERGKKYEELGRVAHTLYRGGAQFPPEITTILATIEEIEGRIEAKNKEIEDLRREDRDKEARRQEAPQPQPQSQPSESPASSFCHNCGASVRPEDVFCSKCGTRIR